MEMEKEPQAEVQEHIDKPNIHEDNVEIPETSYGEPRGAFTFVILVLIFYAAYWIISWFEVFVGRGA